MMEKDVGAVAVIDEQGVVAGMFTERDILAKFALSGREAKATPVRELMSPMVEMATEETTAAEAFKVMLERHYRHLAGGGRKGQGARNPVNPQHSGSSNRRPAGRTGQAHKPLK